MNRRKSWRSWWKKGCVTRSWDSMAAAQRAVTAGRGGRHGPWPWRRVMHEPSGGLTRRNCAGPGWGTPVRDPVSPPEGSNVCSWSIILLLPYSEGEVFTRNYEISWSHRPRCLQPHRILLEGRVVSFCVERGTLELPEMAQTAGGDAETARLHSGRTAPPCRTSRG